MLQAKTLGELEARAAEEFADQPCLGFEGHWQTYAEVHESIDQTARALIASGVHSGEHVAVWMTNRPEWVHLMFALAKVGAVMVPLNTRFRTDDIDYVLRQSDSATFITLDRSGPVNFIEMVETLCPELKECEQGQLKCENFPRLKRVICLGETPLMGVTSWNDFLANAETCPTREIAERSAVSPEDTLFIMYTSGTTGFPKGVMQDHAVIRNAVFTADELKMTSRDCTVMFLPLFHVFGYFEGPLVTWVSGSRMVLIEHFDPAVVLHDIEAESGTVIHGFDTHWHDLMAHPDRERRNLSSLRTGILAVGLESAVPIARQANRELCPTITGYGMTEIMPGALLGSIDDTEWHSCSTSGRPQTGYEFKIIDPTDGRVLAANEQGEILVRGYGLMKGYYNKPEETAATIDEDGWLHTGDMGVRDDEGLYRFVGRYKDMLKVGGENVDPVEIEAFYADHEAIEQIQIVGVPDERLSEVAVAFVQLKPGQDASEQELLEFAKGRIASFKIPRRVFFVDEYPMTSSGKIQREQLRKTAQDLLEQSAKSA